MPDLEQAYRNGYDKAICDVLFHLRYADWQEDTAAAAVAARFGEGYSRETPATEGTAPRQEDA